MSQWGDVAQFITLALLVFHLTRSGLGVSGVVVAEILPVLLLAPVAGPVVDRLSRVHVMVAADLARCVLAALLAVAHGNIALVYVLIFGLSAGSVFFNPAAGSLLPALVGKDELVAADSGIWSAAVLSQVVVAPLGGLLATAAGYGWGFAANAASFAISAILLAGLRSTETPRHVTTTSMWTQAREAVSVLASDRLLRALAIGQALAALSAGATSALLVILAARRLHVSGGGYGLLLSAIAVGAFAGPLLLTRFLARARQARAVFAAFGLRSLVDLVLATVTALPAALAALVFYGVGTSSGNVSFSSVIQSHVPASLRGRIFSAFDLIWHMMRLASLLIGGVLADTLGVRAVYYAGAALLAVAALSGLVATRTGQPRESSLSVNAKRTGCACTWPGLTPWPSFRQEQTKTVQRRLWVLPSRARVYFVLALGIFPQLGYLRVWGKLTAGLADVNLPRPSEKAGPAPPPGPGTVEGPV